mgnify:CR=1 FL=1
MSDMPDTIYARPDDNTPSAGTYCDTDDGGVKYIHADLAPQWEFEEEPPLFTPVLIPGGLAIKKDDGLWYSGMERPLYERPIEWDVPCWMFLLEPPKGD